MPSQETSHLFHTAVIWPATGATNDYGEPTVGVPEEIPCRWETVRREMVKADGTPIGISVLVAVDRQIALDSLMWKGTLEEWYGENGSAGNDDEVMQVVVYNEASDVKCRAIRRELGLMRYKDSPTP